MRALDNRKQLTTPDAVVLLTSCLIILGMNRGVKTGLDENL